MGFIPLFLTASAACMLFFLTVRNSLRSKLILQKNLVAQLALAHPELGVPPGKLLDPKEIQRILKNCAAEKSIPQSSRETLRALKVNQHQFNALIKRAPYNWVATFGGFKPI
ncbi:MAG: hypothetical protein NBV61_00810 [Algoriphagus sp.]|nr:hypothetical protein [Algoriphagus sp.]